MIKLHDVVIWRPFKHNAPQIAYREIGVVTGFIYKESQIQFQPLGNYPTRRTVLARNLSVIDNIQDLVDLADPNEKEL